MHRSTADGQKEKRAGRNGVALRKSRLKVVGDKLIIGERVDRSGLTDVRIPWAPGTRERKRENSSSICRECRFSAQRDYSRRDPLDRSAKGRERRGRYNFDEDNREGYGSASLRTRGN